MTIKKGGKEYTVKDCNGYWSVTLAAGALSVEYKVSKEICKTENELREYVKAEELF